VGSIYLFDLASRHAQWLTARQVVIAGNVANADTPNYGAQDVQPFTEVLDQTRLTMAATSPRHVMTGEAAAALTSPVDGESWAVKASGNSVTLEAELMKAGQTSRAYSLNTEILRAFHRMLMTSVKG
jgi:flagellar basal-body rod protein FlgB